MTTYHDKVQTLPAQASPALSGEEQAFYNLGHHAAQHAAGEIAREADARIAELESSLNGLREEIASKNALIKHLEADRDKAEERLANAVIVLDRLGAPTEPEQERNQICKECGCTLSLVGLGIYDCWKCTHEVVQRSESRAIEAEKRAEELDREVERFIKQRDDVTAERNRAWDDRDEQWRRAEEAESALAAEREAREKSDLHLIDQIGQMEVRAIEAERRAEAVQADIEAAAGELMLPVPAPGTDMARLMLANRLLKARGEALAEACGELEKQTLTTEARAERAERLLEAERQHSAALQEECNKAVDAMEWANGKKAKASQMVARLKGALEIYAKEENWYEAEDGATHRQYFTIYDDGRHLNGWEIAQQALDAPQERGAEGEEGEGVFFDVDGEECCNEELALSRLLEAEVLFCNTATNPRSVVLYVLCNDIFAWAQADAECFTAADIAPLYKLWEANKVWGPIKWVCQKRNEQPQKPVARDMKAAGAWDEDMDKLEPNHFDNRRAALASPGEAGKAEGEVSK